MSLSSDPTYWSTPSSSQNTSSQDQHAFRSTSPSNAHLTFATAAHPYPSSSSSISRLSVATGTASAAAGAIKKLWRRQRDISASPNPNEKSFSLNNNSKSGQQHQHWQAALLSVGPLPVHPHPKPFLLTGYPNAENYPRSSFACSPPKTITSSEGLISPPPSPPDSQSPPTSPTISTWTRCTLTPLVKLERGVYRPSPELLSRSRFSSSEALRGDMGSGGSIGDAGESPLSINSNGNSIFSHSRRSMSVDSTKSTLSILHGVPCGLPHPILVPSRTPFQYDTDNEDNNDDDDDEFRPCPSSLSSIVQLTSPISRSMSPIDNSNDDQNSHTNGSLNSATTVTVTITTEEIAHLGLMRGATTPASSSSEHLKESDPDTKANLIPEEPTFQMNLFAPPDKARITTAHDDEKDAEIGFMRASVQFLNTHHHLSDGRALQRQRSLRGLNSESNSQPSSGGGGDLRRSADVRRKHRTAIYGLGLSHSFPSFETGGALEQEVLSAPSWNSSHSSQEYETVTTTATPFCSTNLDLKGLLPSPSFAIKTATTTPPTNAPQSITTRLAAPSPSALTTYTCSRTQSYNCPKARLMIRTCMSADERFEEMLKEGFQSSDPSLPSPQCLSPTSVAFSDSAIEFNGECDLSDFDPSAASGAPFEVHPAGIRYMTLRLTLTPWHARADETQLYGSEPVLVPSQPSTTALTASPSSSKAIYKGNNNNEMSGGSGGFLGATAQKFLSRTSSFVQPPLLSSSPAPATTTSRPVVFMPSGGFTSKFGTLHPSFGLSGPSSSSSSSDSKRQRHRSVSDPRSRTPTQGTTSSSVQLQQHSQLLQPPMPPISYQPPMERQDYSCRPHGGISLQTPSHNDGGGGALREPRPSISSPSLSALAVRSSSSSGLTSRPIIPPRSSTMGSVSSQSRPSTQYPRQSPQQSPKQSPQQSAQHYPQSYPQQQRQQQQGFLAIPNVVSNHNTQRIGTMSTQIMATHPTVHALVRSSSLMHRHARDQNYF